MSSVLSPVFVVGSTGTLGGELARLLRGLGGEVHATVRDPNSPAAKELQDIGVKITSGDWNDDEALETSIAGCKGLFLNMRPTFQDLSLELKQAKRILSIAKAAGVERVVYSSGVGAGNPEKLKYWDPNSLVALGMLSKQAIENEVRNSDFESWTILRPYSFTVNFIQPKVAMYQDLVQTGVWKTALKPESYIPMIDPPDVAKFAATALSEPERFNGQIITPAAKKYRPDDIMALLSKATGREFHAEYMADEEVDAQRSTNPFVGGFLLMRDFDQFFDEEAVKAWKIPLTTFEEFLDREKDAVRETYSSTDGPVVDAQTLLKTWLK